MAQKQKKSGGNKKIGRNKIKCALYKSLKKREKNKIKKIEKHLKIHKDDLKSLEALLKLKEFIAGK